MGTMYSPAPGDGERARRAGQTMTTKSQSGSLPNAEPDTANLGLTRIRALRSPGRVTSPEPEW